MPISRLVDHAKDKPSEVNLNATLKDAADALGSSSTPALVVTDPDGGQLVSVLTASDFTSAFKDGLAPESSISALVKGRAKPTTVPSDLALGELPSQVGQYSAVVVVDNDGKPTAVLDRKDLAERVLKLR
jgi:CBS domain-containing protein